MAVRVRIDEAAVAALAADPHVLAGVGQVADQIAQAMAARAPRRSGAGARSIHAEPAPNPVDGFRVSWDQDHFYMSFQNDGTNHQRARHFVEDALQRFQH